MSMKLFSEALEITLGQARLQDTEEIHFSESGQGWNLPVPGFCVQCPESIVPAADD